MSDDPNSGMGPFPARGTGSVTVNITTTARAVVSVDLDALRAMEDIPDGPNALVLVLGQTLLREIDRLDARVKALESVNTHAPTTSEGA